MQGTVPKNLGLRKDTAFALVISAIVVLVGVGCFGLGRLTALGEREGTQLAIHAPEMPAALAVAVPADAPVAATPAPDQEPIASPDPAPVAPPAAHNFVASKNGTKYYAPTCSGALRIKPTNQVWFSTEADAKSAGYTLSATCK